MNPTGSLDDDGRTLELVRRFTAPIADVWASVVESERLARWYGTWSGDPSTGSVMVTMTAEADPVPPVRHDIRECEAPRLLSLVVNDDQGNWYLTLELTEADGVTTLTLRQERIDPSLVPDIGPGWEWYLDRLAASMSGEPLPSLADFEITYLPMAEAYRALVD